MIHIETKTVCIRGGQNFKKFGDPYDYCISAFIDGDTAYFYGLVGKFSLKTFREIKSELNKIGVVHAYWERKKSKYNKQVEV